jgi:hypothetical protein
MPSHYSRLRQLIALLSIALVAGFAWFAEAERPSLAHVFRVDGPMFLMGAAFMLLETKSIVTFGLLFGTTWLTSIRSACCHEPKISRNRRPMAMIFLTTTALRSAVQDRGLGMARQLLRVSGG